MLAFVARLRPRVAAIAAAAIIWSSCLPEVAARDDVFFTSSVSYCEPPELILVQQFDVLYYASNNSIFFNISAASVEDNVNVSANIAFTIYGSSSIDYTIDLCSLLNGALCPLPTYNFVGSDTIALPDSIDLSSKIPAIGYKIPDLEAFAQLTLKSVDTGDIKACVQATLSNGWSTRQVAVQWVLGLMALLALASALLATLYAYPSRAPDRLLDLMFLFQAIASSALLDLNYPVVYRSFATNFSWALGLFSSTSGSALQTAINNMRHKTGGALSDASGDGVDLVNRKLSPYNVDAVTTAGSSQTLAAVKSLQQKINAASVNSSIARAARMLAKRDTTVTVTSDNVLNAGIPVYAGSIGISVGNVFMSAFFTLLFLTLITLFILGVGYACVLLVSKRREKKGLTPGRAEEWKQNYPYFAKAWGLRMVLIVFLPIFLFGLHQWTLKDSWLSILISVITILAILACVAWPTFLTFRLVHRNDRNTDVLYEGNQQHLASYGPLYSRFRPARYYFFAFALLILVVRAIVIGFGTSNGLAQVVVLLIFELAFFIATLVLRPHDSRGSEVLCNTLTIARILITGLSFAFVEKFNVAAIPRVAIGIVSAVIGSLAVILMFFNIITNLGLKTLWREHIMRRWGAKLGSRTRLSSPSRSNSGASTPMRDLEKSDEKDRTLANVSTNSAPSSERPRNPTPTSNVPLDPAVIIPYPTVTPAASHDHSIPSSTSTNFDFRNSDYRVSYTSSQMPVTATTLDSFRASSASGHSESTFGRELPRRAQYEGLGLEGHSNVAVEGAGSGPSSRRDSSVYGSAPSTPATSTSSHSHTGGKRTSLVGGGARSTLHPMNESDEGTSGAVSSS